MNTFAFTTVDYVVIVVIFLSSLLGLMRGFFREALSLIGFGASMWLSYHYASKFSENWLKTFPGGEAGRLALAFLAIFIVTWLVCKVLATLIGNLINKVGLSSIDRLLGAGFGLARGILIVVVLSTLAALTSIPKSNEWKDALTRPGVEVIVGVVRSWLPPDWAKKVSEATDIRLR